MEILIPGVLPTMELFISLASKGLILAQNTQDVAFFPSQYWKMRQEVEKKEMRPQH